MAAFFYLIFLFYKLNKKQLPSIENYIALDCSSFDIVYLIFSKMISYFFLVFCLLLSLFSSLTTAFKCLPITNIHRKNENQIKVKESMELNLFLGPQIGEYMYINVYICMFYIMKMYTCVCVYLCKRMYICMCISMQT